MVALRFCEIRILVDRKDEKPYGYPTDPKTLGERIRKARMDKGWLQKDLAKLLEVCENTITGWENNRCKPTHRNLNLLKRFLTTKLALTLSLL